MSNASSFALFDTPIGRMGIAWGGDGIVGVQLPEGSDSRTLARLRRRIPAAVQERPPANVTCVIDGIVDLLRGQPRDFVNVLLDMRDVPAFHQRVYEVARRIPAGATLTYGEIAARLGSPGAARAVGQALGRNPYALVVPCHRVLAAGDRIGGFSAGGGIATKLRLLAIEGVNKPYSAELFHAAPVFAYDPIEAIAHPRSRDATLGRLIDAVGPFRMELKATQSLFVALAESIVHQQLNGKAAATIFARLCSLFPRAQEGPTPERVLRASDEKLRSAGLSRQKLEALRDLARRAADGGLPTLIEVGGMDDEAIIERLCRVRGIGRWTVAMLLIFRLGRADVLPVDDFAIRKGFSAVFGNGEPKPDDVRRRGDRWQPYRTVASWYLWRAAAAVE